MRGHPVTSVDRALALVLLLDDRGSLRVTDAAAELGVAPSTAHRLLSVLVARGFAVRDEHRAYRRGPALRGTREPRPSARWRAARPQLQQLADAVGETVQLMVLQGVSVRFVDGVEAPRPLRVTARVGFVLPAHLTSGGKALLAQRSADQLDALYARGLRLVPEAAGPDLGALRRELAAVRRRGYALNTEQSERGLLAVGAAVPDPERPSRWAVAISVPAARMPRRQLAGLAPVLLDAVARIGGALR